jgi:hypothetical protein
LREATETKSKRLQAKRKEESYLKFSPRKYAMIRFLLCFMNWKRKLTFKLLPTSVDTRRSSLEDKIIACNPYGSGDQHDNLYKEFKAR